MPLAERPRFSDGGGSRNVAWWIWEPAHRHLAPEWRLIRKADAR
jgi:hypothetical protein